MSITNEVIRLIYKEIKKGGKSIQDFASELNTYGSKFSKMKFGEEKLSIDLLYEIAKKLNINPVSLLPKVDNPRHKPDFEDFIWGIIEERIDKYLDEKLKKTK